MGATLTEYVCNSFDDFVTNCKSFFAANGYSMGEDVGNSFISSINTGELSERFLVNNGVFSFYFSFMNIFNKSISYKYYEDQGRGSASIIGSSYPHLNYIGIGIPELVDSSISNNLSEPLIIVPNIGISGFPLSLKIFKFSDTSILFCIEVSKNIYRFLLVGNVYNKTLSGFQSYTCFSGSSALYNRVPSTPRDSSLTALKEFYTSTNYVNESFGFMGNAAGLSYSGSTSLGLTTYVKINNSWFGLSMYGSSSSTFRFYLSENFHSTSPFSIFSNYVSYLSGTAYKTSPLLKISYLFSSSSLNNFPLLFDSLIFSSIDSGPLSIFGYFFDIYIAQSSSSIEIYDISMGNNNYKIIPIIKSINDKSILGSFAIKMG